MLKVLQINLHHSKAASAELLLALSSGGQDMALIQEPWVTNKGEVKGLGLRGYRLYTAQTEGKKRSAILAKNELNLLLHTNFSNNDQTVVLCEDGRGAYTLFASTYMAHDREAPPQDFRLLVEEAKERKLNLVIGGDFNAHHEIWGSNDTNERGESIFVYLLRTNLTISNRGNVPTYNGLNSKNVMDVTVYTENVNCKIVDWRVLEKPSMSDHNYISFTVLTSVSLKAKIIRNARNTDWIKYQAVVQDTLGRREIGTIWNTQLLERTVGFVTCSLSNAFERSCPVSRPSRNPKPPWWSEEIRAGRQMVQTLFKRAKTLNDQSAWSVYRSALKDYKKELRKAKRRSWRDFCEQIEKTSDTARLRKVLSKGHTQQGLICRPNGQWTRDGRETLEVLMETHFPGCKEISPTQGVKERHQTIERLNAGILSYDRVRWALNSFSPYKAPGPDGILPAMLQRVDEYIIPWLLAIFRASLKLNYIPEAWTQARVVFIPKAGRSGHVKPKDFRPISLTSFMLKTLERVLDSVIREKLKPNYLVTAQHAYTKGRSVNTALHEVVFGIEKSLQCKEYVLATFLDIEGAFNNVTLEAITNALEAAEIDPVIRRWITTLLTNRKIKAELGGMVIQREVYGGTPQGGVLSPLMWILVINRILRSLTREGTNVVAYADDVVILTPGKCLATISNLAGTALRKLNSWAKSSGLGINAQKTEAVLFTRKYKVPNFRMPTLDGVQIPLKQEARYLGLILDSKLSWKPNIEERVTKANRAFYACSRLFGKRWGLKPQITHWTYTAIVRPILMYGVMVWWPAVEKKTYLQKLERAQRLATLGITGALSSTPSTALNTILHLPPVDLYAKYNARRDMLLLKESGLLNTRSYGHSRLSAQLGNATDYLVPIMTFKRNYKVILPSRQMWESGELNRTSNICIYTDGSKSEAGVGAAVFSEELKISESYRLPDKCSIFQAEIVAIRKAAEIAHRMVPTEINLSIFVDSQTALKALEANLFKSKTVLECYQALQVLSACRRTSICWVPGQKGIRGNEAADALAKEGATRDLQEAVDILIPIQEVKSELGKEIMLQSEERWGKSSSCSKIKVMWEGYDLRKTNFLLSLGRIQCSALIGIITGHCLVREFAHKIGIGDTVICRYCQEPGSRESVEHVICHCPALMRTRLRVLGSTELKDLREVSRLGLSSVLHFAMRTGLYKGN